MLDWAVARPAARGAAALESPPPWWRKWWVWAITGSVIAAGTGIAVYAASWEPSNTVGGDVTAD